jgi:putative transposase
LRTSNLIESVFSTIRLRTTKSKNCGSRSTTLAMVLKLMETAQKRWLRLRGYNLLADVITGVKFRDGIKQKQQDQDAA